MAPLREDAREADQWAMLSQSTTNPEQVSVVEPPRGVLVDYEGARAEHSTVAAGIAINIIRLRPAMRDDLPHVPHPKRRGSD
jgi:hypothetical protein